MMRVLVTGGAGYIGRYVLRALDDAGRLPLWLDRRPVEGVWALEGTVVDMLDAAAFGPAFRRLAPDAVIHLAAHSSVAESMTHPFKYRENVQMCRHLAAVAGSLPVVLASSAAVYGEGGAKPVVETMRPQPANPYGRSKLDSEAVLERAMALRFFNVAGGAGDQGDHIVPRLTQACAHGVRATLNGQGLAVRDFVHVEDVARACVDAVLALSVGRRPEVLNICSGRGRSMRQVAAACVRVSGRDLTTADGGFRAGDVSTLIGDNRRALEAIGWAPRYDFEDIVASAWLGAAAAA